MTHTGYSAHVRASAQEDAIREAVMVLEARHGREYHEVPLYVEDLGDGTWEVVLRRRVSPKAEKPVTGSFHEREGRPFAGIPEPTNEVEAAVFAMMGAPR